MFTNLHQILWVHLINQRMPRAKQILFFLNKMVLLSERMLCLSRVYLLLETHVIYKIVRSINGILMCFWMNVNQNGHIVTWFPLVFDRISWPLIIYKSYSIDQYTTVNTYICLTNSTDLSNILLDINIFCDGNFNAIPRWITMTVYAYMK